VAGRGKPRKERYFLLKTPKGAKGSMERFIARKAEELENIAGKRQGDREVT